MRTMLSTDRLLRITATLALAALLPLASAFGEIAVSPTEAKIRRIVASMTLEQKIGQMTQPEIGSVTPAQVRNFYIGSVLNGGGSWPHQKKHASPGEWVELADQFYEASMTTDMRIRIPIIWGTDAVHGHGNAFGATLFPHNIGLGAANDVALIGRIGKSVGKQVRATGIQWVFGPTIAVAQDVRWGRTYESFSEDPVLVSQYASAYIKGMQGTFLTDANVVATAKHFMGDGSTEYGKDQGVSKVSQSQMLGVHAQAYYSAVHANVGTVMASFNSWNDVASGVDYGKMHGSKLLLTDLLKTKMGFDGFVVSDWNGVEQVPGCSKVRCAQAINAGIDMVMVPSDWQAFIANTVELVRSGEIPMARIDDAVTRIVRVKLRAGLFGKSPSHNVYAGKSGALLERALAREAVRKSLVLLKNERHVLPVAKGKKILVVGKSADSIQNQTGGWSLGWQGTGNSNFDFPVADSVLAGLREALGAAKVDFSVEAHDVDVRRYEAVIAVIGETPYAETVGDVEGYDTLRHSRRYPEDLQVLKAVSGKGVPVISVFLTGRPAWVNDLLNLSDAFVVAWLPGTEGKGISDVLVGTSAGKPRHNFSGRLSFSWPGNECPEEAGKGQSRVVPLYARNDGLRYGETRRWNRLKESEVELGCRREKVLPIFNQTNRGAFSLYVASEDAGKWQTMRLPSDPNAKFGFPEETPKLRVETVQINTQQDAKLFHWLQPASVGARTEGSVDLHSYVARGVLAMDVLVDQLPESPVMLAMECGLGCQGGVDVTKWLRQSGLRTKGTLTVPLACFQMSGVQFHRITAPFQVIADAPFSAAFANIRIEEDASSSNQLQCNQTTPWQLSRM